MGCSSRRWEAEREDEVPVNSLWVQWAWTCLLCLSGSYGQLLDYVIFAVLIFYILTIVGCLCCGGRGRMRRGRTRRSGIRCCRRCIS
jgi:amino acid transporter